MGVLISQFVFSADYLLLTLENYQGGFSNILNLVRAFSAGLIQELPKLLQMEIAYNCSEYTCLGAVEIEMTVKPLAAL